MKFLWISGWAIPPSWFAAQAALAWPKGRHHVVTPAAAETAVQSEEYDVLGGYSLGALWLLKNAAIIPANIPVILLAPIFAFSAEAGYGGRISLAQLRLQRRHLRQDASAAIANFYRLAGLDAPGLLDDGPNSITPERVAELEQGLDWLEKWRAPKQRLPTVWHGFVGEGDPLLDAAALRAICPELQVVAGAGHEPGPLLRAAAAALEQFPFSRTHERHRASASPTKTPDEPLVGPALAQRRVCASQNRKGSEDGQGIQ